MDETPQLPERETPPDAIRIVADARGAVARRVGLAAALIVIALAAFVAVRALDRPSPDRAQSTAEQPSSATPGPGRADLAERRNVRAIRVPAKRRTAAQPDAADSTQAGAGQAPADTQEDRPEIDAGDYIAALRAAGETEGIAAFNPPGTRPPEPGVVVPDDYELPEGFMRHYQSTDDGRQLQPVLTVAPGYELVDENGQVLALGRDRIVPPELAPPDLPVRILDVPSAGRAREPR